VTSWRLFSVAPSTRSTGRAAVLVVRTTAILVRPGHPGLTR
jgi:hypothetical protein